MPYLIKLIWAFPERVRPRILDDMAKGGTRTYHVRLRGDLRDLFDDLKVR